MGNEIKQTCAFCEECNKKVECEIYNWKVKPVILTCAECWQFLQQ